MPISREEVRKVSLLARLLPDEATVERLTEQLGGILDYMDLLAEVDTEGVEPMSHPHDVSNVFRDDEVRESLPRDAALANAPQRDDECYRVPAVLGEM